MANGSIYLLAQIESCDLLIPLRDVFGGSRDVMKVHQLNTRRCYVEGVRKYLQEDRMVKKQATVKRRLDSTDVINQTEAAIADQFGHYSFMNSFPHGTFSSLGLKLHKQREGHSVWKHIAGDFVSSRSSDKPETIEGFCETLRDRVDSAMLYHEILLRAYRQLVSQIDMLDIDERVLGKAGSYKVQHGERVLIDWLEDWHGSHLANASGEDCAFMAPALERELLTLATDLRELGLLTT